MKKLVLNDKKNKFKKLILELTRRKKNLNVYEQSSFDKIIACVKRLYNELRFNINQKDWNVWVYKGLIAAGIITTSVVQAQETPSFDTGTLVKSNGGNVYLSGGRASLSIADIDGDGDLELVAGTRTSQTGYENGYTATPKFKLFDGFNLVSGEFEVETDLDTNDYTVSNDEFFYSYANPSFVDIDGDGDMDLVAGDYTKKLAVLINDGNQNFTFSNYLEVAGDEISAGNFSKAVFADIDDDGDMDMLLGERHASGNGYESQIHLYVNSGGAGNPVIFDTPSTILQANNKNIGLEITGFHMPAPFLVDYDGDGDLDLFVGINSGKLFYFENVGSATTHSFSSGKEILMDFEHEGFYGSMASPIIADIDGDGDLDLIVGFGENSDTSGVMYLFNGKNTTMGVDDSDRDTLKIYPNPVNDILYLDSKNTFEEVSIFSIMGQKILTTKNSRSVDLSALPSGTYIISALYKGKKTTKKLIKK